MFLTWALAAARFRCSVSPLALPDFFLAIDMTPLFKQSEPVMSPKLHMLLGGYLRERRNVKSRATQHATPSDRILPHKSGCDRRRCLTINLAQIYAWTGQKIAPSNKLRPALAFCNSTLIWDLLRGDPRSEKIAASLASKQRPDQLPLHKAPTRESHRSRGPVRLVCPSAPQCKMAPGQARSPRDKTFGTDDRHLGELRDRREHADTSTLCAERWQSLKTTQLRFERNVGGRNTAMLSRATRLC